ncbi:Ankyrin repeat domain-containing 34B [Paramuricea clavata]|uniref:Ankyrin repeat domain-containing 34B n=1 Tax=Paramuricea clavata TaxID=317549 RepID=A0A7D9DJF8_PARCT|nr:Ankyrin repeat domain-containing 34B [Paramuricea clavata]
MAYKVNASGRSYRNGMALSDDMRSLIIDEIVKEGGDRVAGYMPVTYTEIARRLSVSRQSVKKIWQQFCESNDISVKSRGGSHNCKLTPDDLELIETLKTAQGSISLSEICEILQEGNDGQDIVSISAISRAIKSNLLSGKKYSRKKISHVARQRFTATNVLYKQLFIDYLSSKDASKIKFFDEAGIKMPDVGTRLYGNAPVGERCIEVVKRQETPNTTLNLLVSLNGVEYYNLIDGASNTVQFLNFFEEASNAVNFETRRPALEVGDTIVMDNCGVHHYEGGQALEEFLADMGIELLYTPAYSPELNPVEFCFNKIKTQLNFRFRRLFHANAINMACALALETITNEDMKQFYNYAAYLFED